MQFRRAIPHPVGVSLTDLLFAGWFNWDFVYGLHDNWLSKLFMSGDGRSWDGGFFGPLTWGIAMMAGTLAYDLVETSATRAAASAQLIGWGLGFMAVGYAMSCLTRAYDLTGNDLVEMQNRHIRQDAERSWLERLAQREQMRLPNPRKSSGRDKSHEALEVPSQSRGSISEAEAERIRATISVLRDQQRRYGGLELADDPVLPPLERLKGRSLSGLLSEPPFVAPPPDNPFATSSRQGPSSRGCKTIGCVLGERMPEP